MPNLYNVKMSISTVVLVPDGELNLSDKGDCEDLVHVFLECLEDDKPRLSEYMKFASKKVLKSKDLPVNWSMNCIPYCITDKNPYEDFSIKDIFDNKAAESKSELLIRLRKSGKITEKEYDALKAEE